MKENREPVHRARVQTFEIEYVLRDCNYSLWESWFLLKSAKFYDVDLTSCALRFLCKLFKFVYY